MDPVRFSHLKYMALSPAHYKSALKRRVDSPAMRLGRAVHAIVLGTELPQLFEGERRGKVWEAFRSIHSDQEILTETEYRRASDMAGEVLANKDAFEVLKGRAEVPISWTYLGRNCQSQIDMLGDEHITDLKTCKTAHPDWFGRGAIRMNYHTQLAFYRDAVAASGRPRPSRAYIVAVESAPPYAVSVLKLTDRTLEMGERTYRLWFERLLACEAANEWPGYVQSIVDLDIPDETELIFPDESEAA